MRNVSKATKALRDVSTSAESGDEVELLASRPETECKNLKAARCHDAGTSDLREAKRLFGEARRVRSGYKTV